MGNELSDSRSANKELQLEDDGKYTVIQSGISRTSPSKSQLSSLSCHDLGSNITPSPSKSSEHNSDDNILFCSPNQTGLIITPSDETKELSKH